MREIDEQAGIFGGSLDHLQNQRTIDLSSCAKRRSWECTI